MSVPWFPGGPRATPLQNQFVTLVVRDEAGRRVTRTMGKTQNLQLLMDFYYSTMAAAVKHGSGVLEYRGTQIVFPNQQQPAEYDMKDGDVIDFVPVTKPERLRLVTPVIKERHGDYRSFACTVRRTDPVQGLMDFYHKMVPDVQVAFKFDGRLLRGNETLDDLSIEDGGLIVVSLL